MGRFKLIESPEVLWNLFLKYKKHTKQTPIIVKDWVGKDATDVYREKEKPLTIEGFENYLEDEDIIGDIGKYMSNDGDNYSEYRTICSRIKRNVKQDQIEGGMAGIYNPSITQRLNGLVDKKETEIKGNLNIPNLPDIGERK
jgi:cellulase/cellobiase CelA1